MIRKNIKLSIIIPLYNTPPEYFLRCVRSIMSSEPKNIEVLIIDDGSLKENSIIYQKICSDYADFRYYYQMNTGVSIARNTGIEYATGDYILFIDSDDTVDKSFIEEGRYYAGLYDADIILGQIDYVHGEKNIKNKEEKMYYLNSSEDIKKLKLSLLGIKQDSIELPVLGSPCGRFYRTSIAKKIAFPNKVAYWEDQIFNRLFFNNIDSAVITSHIWYYYHQNDFSAMHNQFNSQYIQRAIPFWTVWKDINDDETNIDIKLNLMLKGIDFFFAAVHLNIFLSDSDWKKKKAYFDLLRKQPIFKEIRNDLNYSKCNTVADKLRLFLIKHNLDICSYFFVALKHYLKKGRNKRK